MPCQHGCHQPSPCRQAQSTVEAQVRADEQSSILRLQSISEEARFRQLGNRHSEVTSV